MPTTTAPAPAAAAAPLAQPFVEQDWNVAPTTKTLDWGAEEAEGDWGSADPKVGKGVGEAIYEASSFLFPSFPPSFPLSFPPFLFPSFPSSFPLSLPLSLLYTRPLLATGDV